MPGSRQSRPISRFRSGWRAWWMNSHCQMKPSRPVSLQPDIAMTDNLDGLSAAEIAQAVTGRKMSALDVTEAALVRIAKHDPVLNSFTDVTGNRARAKARVI